MHSFMKNLASAAVLAITASTALAATTPAYSFKHPLAELKTSPAVVTPPPPPPGITIVNATFFNPNTHDYNGNITAKLGPLCSGKPSCSFNPGTLIGDPYPGIFKGVRVDYTCSGVAKTYSKEGYRYEAGSETHTIACP
jgi:hypothetical protein